MNRRILITGANGSIGRKLAEYFTAAGDEVLRLDRAPHSDKKTPTIIADLSQPGKWTRSFAAVDTVIHLAGDPSPHADWMSVQKNNIEGTRQVLRAALNRSVHRVVFASSNWVMAGYRYRNPRKLTTDLPPHPINPYGVSKLIGENLGAQAVDAGLSSFIALRIGYCQGTPGNRPGPHMGEGTWGQLIWLSDRDMCHGVERSVIAPNVNHAVLNLMSDNPGMRWDLEATRRVIGYAPEDGAAAVVTPAVRRQEARMRLAYKQLRKFTNITANL